MKIVFIFLLLTTYQNIFSKEASFEIKNSFPVESFTQKQKCHSYHKIDGEEYCVEKSNITLNSCGPSSDWPCMEDQGCLVIEKFTSK